MSSCKICNTTKNLRKNAKSKTGFCNICNSCFMKKKNESQRKTTERKQKERIKQYKLEQENKKCKYCNTKENLRTRKGKYGIIVKYNLCKKCYSELKKKQSKTMWDNRTNKEKEIFIEKIQKKRRVTLSNRTEQEKQEFSDKVSNGVIKFYETASDEWWDNYKEKHKISMSKVNKEERNKKFSKTFKNMPVEKKKERMDKIYATKIKNGTLNKRPGGFGHKAQKLFWWLDDNLIDYKPIYATMNTRDIKNRQNDEQLINVKFVSKKFKARRLDFYLKTEKLLLNVEFDESSHKNRLKEDIIREKELLALLPHLIILRIKEYNYEKHEEKVQKDLLNIINLFSKGIVDWNIVPKYMLPLHKSV